MAGGWGLGAAVFALLGAIVLVVEHIRHNEDRLDGTCELTSTQPRSSWRPRLALACYVRSSWCPAMRCYGRVWEKLAAGLLTLYVLGTMLGIGAAIGLAIVWTYDTYA